MNVRPTYSLISSSFSSIDTPTCSTSPLSVSHLASNPTLKTTIFTPINFNNCACSPVNSFPSLHNSCPTLNVGTPLTIDVANPSFLNCGSSLCGNGSGGSEKCLM